MQPVFKYPYVLEISRKLSIQVHSNIHKAFHLVALYLYLNNFTLNVNKMMIKTLDQTQVVIQHAAKP